MDIFSVIRHLTVLLLVLEGICGANTPPSLASEKDWFVLEEDPVGTRVTTLRVGNVDGDAISFNLESLTPGQDIHKYFKIDDHLRVIVAKPLTGLAGENSRYYFLRVRMTDSNFDSVTDVRLQVAKSKGGNRNGGTPGGREGWPHFGGLGNFGAGPPPFPGTPAIPGPPWLNNGEPVNGFVFHPNPDKPVPPILKLHHNWQVSADAPVGSNVSMVEVINTSEDDYNLTLQDDQGLFKIDQSGLVTVAKSLVNKVGNLAIRVTVANVHSSTFEPVIVQIDPPEPSSSSPPNVLVEVSTTSTSKPRPLDSGSNSQDLLVVGSPSGGANSPGGSSPTGTDKPEEAPEADISLTIIPIVMIAGISPVALALYCYWRRLQRRKARAEAKESAVVYSEKGEEAIATQVPPRRTNSSDSTQTRRSSRRIDFAALWRRRVQSNKYEEDITGRGDGIMKRKMSEISSPSADNWEFPRHHLKFMGILGEGCFGQVWKCEAVGLRGTGSMLVAVKTLKESAGERERRDLIQELKVLKNLGYHINVVSFLGCCTEKDPIFIILEYLVGGKLQSFLRASRADASYDNLHGSSSSLTPRDLTQFAYQISRGMEFLARNGIIHRDLAARNVLVGEDKICKVADFGFARDVANNRVYERKSDGRLPIRWMAPESLFDNIFTTKSDVWSFGVLLWEIVTLGSTPYPGLGASEVMRKVKEGYRLEKPDHCRREVYNIMYYCWDKDPKERPSFTELVHTLESLLLTEVDYIELDRFPDHSYYNIISEKTDELL